MKKPPAEFHVTIEHDDHPSIENLEFLSSLLAPLLSHARTLIDTLQESHLYTLPETMFLLGSALKNMLSQVSEEETEEYTARQERLAARSIKILNQLLTEHFDGLEILEILMEGFLGKLAGNLHEVWKYQNTQEKNP